MSDARLTWTNTTHDWAATVDPDHLDAIRFSPARYSSGVAHLVLEVLAYADDEAAATRRQGRCTVGVHPDGSVSVADDGRGTDTRLDGHGAPVRKPVMATRDLRFFDGAPTAHLPDGAPRRGMSVVAALSRWLVHTNRRHEGAWSQRYEYGVPVTGLVPVDPGPATGTTVHFLADPALVGSTRPTAGQLRALATGFAHLEVTVVDRYTPSAPAGG